MATISLTKPPGLVPKNRFNLKEKDVLPFHPEESHLQLIRQHFPQLPLPQHMEALVQHLPFVLQVSPDGLEGQAQVQAAVLDVAADSVQLRVGQVI